MSIDTLEPPRPPENFEIHQATLQDIEQLAVCMQPVYADTYPNDKGISRDMFGDDFGVHLREYLATQIENEQRPLWFIKEGDRVMGTIGLEVDKGPDEAEVWGFYVLPEEQEAGIGSRLWNGMMTTAKDKGFKRLFLHVGEDSIKAQEFYKHRGFTFFGEPLVRNWPSWLNDSKEHKYRYLQMEKYLRGDKQ